MELEIFWTKLAENKLQGVFDYYKTKAGVKTAKKIVSKIVKSTVHLSKNPRIGRVVELLNNSSLEFRYLVVTNYKIIYYINENKSRIIVANLFDTRQNPEKIKETI